MLSYRAPWPLFGGSSAICKVVVERAFWRAFTTCAALSLLNVSVDRNSFAIVIRVSHRSVISSRSNMCGRAFWARAACSRTLDVAFSFFNFWSTCSIVSCSDSTGSPWLTVGPSCLQLDVGFSFLIFRSTCSIVSCSEGPGSPWLTRRRWSF